MRLRHCTLAAALALVVMGLGSARASVGTAGTKASSATLTAKFSHQIESRIDKSWASWSATDEQYAADYANPKSWKLTLDGCESTGSRTITSYQWRIQPLVPGEKTLPWTVTGSPCSRQVTLGKLGAYRIWLTVTSADGASNTTSKSGTLRDLLVVSIGDSLSSGEGNPDKNQGLTPELAAIPAVWKNQQCHRSATSWSARVARGLEDKLTTVTFMNYACSGAELRHLYANGYYGIEAGNLLLPQLEAVRKTLGDPTALTTRSVDALLMTVGINDLGFSSLLDRCAHSFNSDCTKSLDAARTKETLKVLPARYDLLDSAIGTSVRAARVYLVELPARLFTDSNDRHGGCGAFELGMRSDEAHWISDRGDELNAVMQAASQRHGWTYVSGVREKFRGHGYCADDDDTWFRSYSGSKKLQGNDRGTAHPNPEGHQMIAEVASKFVSADPGAPLPVQRLHIRVKSVRLDDTSAATLQSHCKEDRDSPLIGEDRWVALCQRVRLVVPNTWERSVTGSGVVRRGETGTALPLGRTVVFNPALEFDIDTYGNSIAIWASSRVAVNKLYRWQEWKNPYPTELVEASIVLRRSDRWKMPQTTITGANQKATLRIDFDATPIALPPTSRVTSGASRAVLGRATLGRGGPFAVARQGDHGYVCDQKDMRTLETVPYQFLWETPSALNCDFRLFLEPERPLHWTGNEYFFGGSFWFVFCRPSGCSPEGIETFDMGMSDVMRYLDQIDQHLFWGKASTPDAELKELKLRRGPIFHEDDGTLRQQTYHAFAPQEPGLYKWRYEYDDHTIWSAVARGEVCIEPAQGKRRPSCAG